MGRRDVRRLGVLQAAIAGKLTNREGAAALGLQLRQFKRLRRRLREAGPTGVVHGNRGKASSRRLPEEVRAQVIDLLVGEVKLNDHHITDLLEARGTTVSPASVRRIRRELKIPAKRRRRPPRHHRRRTRQARRGALVLIDGSPFHWFDAAGSHWTLLGAIDDATGEILALTLRPSEDLHGYLVLLNDLVRTHGVPVALYGDRSGILIRRLWGTLQDRLAALRAPDVRGRLCLPAALQRRAQPAPLPRSRRHRVRVPSRPTRARPRPRLCL